MIRRPPRTKQFPYNTRFRSQAEHGIRDSSVTGVQTYAVFCLRSEEHTSELQSHLTLVSRPLLQKKQQHQLDPDECPHLYARPHAPPHPLSPPTHLPLSRDTL